MNENEQVTKFVTTNPERVERLPYSGEDEVQWTRPKQDQALVPQVPDVGHPHRSLAIGVLANYVEDIAYGIATQGWLYTNGTLGGFEWACEAYGVRPERARAALQTLLRRTRDRGHYVNPDGEREPLKVGKSWREGDEGAVWTPPARSTLGERLCKHCQVVWFVPGHGSQQHCSPKCKDAYSRLTEQARDVKRRELTAKRRGNFRHGQGQI